MADRVTERLERDRGRLMAGLVLSALGIAFLLMEFTQELGTATILVLLGAAFIVGYFDRDSYGMLIAGCVLLGLGAGSLVDTAGWGFGNLTTVGLGAGFLAIFLIDLLYRRSTRWWPLAPGAALLVTGLWQQFAVIQVPVAQSTLTLIWPAALVLLGLGLLASALLTSPDNS